MKLADPRLVERLAAEYVLGTLRGAARRRFERALAVEPAVAAAVDAWQARLAPLSGRFPAVAPRPDSWQRIAARVGLSPAAAPASTMRVRRWSGRPLALAAAVALLAVGITFWARDRQPEYRAAATVAATDGRTLWQVELSSGRERLRVAAVAAIAVPAGKDFELWALPAQGAPVSLGLMPAQGQLARTLTPRQQAALASARQVAVSIEPRGGSTTGTPTGPVVHVVPLTLAAAGNLRGTAPG